MSVALIVKDVDHSRRRKCITYEPTFSSTYNATLGGDVLDFLAATNPENKLSAYPGSVPDEIAITNPVAGFSFQAIPGTTNKLKIFDGPGLEEYVLNDIKGATAITAAMATADQAAAPVNSTYIVAEATFAATKAAKTLTVAKQPDVPRNVVVTIHNDSGGPLNLYVGTCKVTVTGKDMDGRTRTEDISLTVLDANKAVANTKFRMWAGLCPFASISSITYDHESDDGLKICVGPGTKMGIPSGLENGAEADVQKFTVKGEDLSVTGTVDTTWYTIASGTLADGDDVQVLYRKNAEFPAGKALPASLTAADTYMRIKAYFRSL